MIVVNECRIDSERGLIIDASIENLSYFANNYIYNISIDTENTFVNSNSVSQEPIFSKTFEEYHQPISADCECFGNTVSSEDNDCNCGNIFTSSTIGHKRVRLVLSQEDLGTDLNHIFFIFITANGTPDSCVPCGYDNANEMAVAVNLRSIYNKAMSYVRDANNECSIPKSFIDFILKLKALKLCFKTGNFTEAIERWKALKTNKVISVSKGCGCGNK